MTAKFLNGELWPPILQKYQLSSKLGAVMLAVFRKKDWSHPSKSLSLISNVYWMFKLDHNVSCSAELNFEISIEIRIGMANENSNLLIL